MNHYETRILQKTNLQRIRCYRYVDDTASLYKVEQLPVLSKVNTIHLNLQFTMEREIQVLDLPNKRFQTSIYRKPTAGEQYIHAKLARPQ